MPMQWGEEKQLHSANEKTESQKVQVTHARGYNIPIVALELNSDS